MRETNQNLRTIFKEAERQSKAEEKKNTVMLENYRILRSNGTFQWQEFLSELKLQNQVVVTHQKRLAANDVKALCNETHSDIKSKQITKN